jgi:hypothetical protein
MTMEKTRNRQPLGASFRDPSGFVYRREGVLYRQVNPAGREDYHALMDTGLYQELVSAGLLVSHEEVTAPALSKAEGPGLSESEEPEPYKTLRPEPIEFVSYPYEWCFGAYKSAALATLAIQKRALKRGASLKDSSAYNIQFKNGRPLLIDSLSFEPYREGEPWTAYRQFCQHFYAPLALMATSDIRLGQLMRVFIDGLPLDLTSRLLPRRTRLNFAHQVHLHLHARSQRRYADPTADRRRVGGRINRQQLLGLIASLDSGIRQLAWRNPGTEWSDYLSAHNYSPAALEHKAQTIQDFVEQVQPAQVWDLGANTGTYSRIASQRGIPTISFDIDPGAVEQNYQQMVARQESHLLPLLLDLTNPSPALGWQLRERSSLLERGPVEAVFALALVHHLAIANNVPLAQLAEFFAGLCRWLLIEFVPKSDSQVQRLLSMRKDIFPDYTQPGFESSFSERFDLRARQPIRDSQRVLYLMEKRNR